MKSYRPIQIGLHSVLLPLIIVSVISLIKLEEFASLTVSLWLLPAPRLPFMAGCGGMIFQYSLRTVCYM